MPLISTLFLTVTEAPFVMPSLIEGSDEVHDIDLLSFRFLCRYQIPGTKVQIAAI